MIRPGSVPTGKRLVIEYVSALLSSLAALTNTGKFYFAFD